MTSFMLEDEKGKKDGRAEEGKEEEADDRAANWSRRLSEEQGL